MDMMLHRRSGSSSSSSGVGDGQQQWWRKREGEERRAARNGLGWGLQRDVCVELRAVRRLPWLGVYLLIVQVVVGGVLLVVEGDPQQVAVGRWFGPDLWPAAAAVRLLPPDPRSC